jgi:hypothetical protein
VGSVLAYLTEQEGLILDRIGITPIYFTVMNPHKEEQYKAIPGIKYIKKNEIIGNLDDESNASY